MLDAFPFPIRANYRVADRPDSMLSVAGQDLPMGLTMADTGDLRHGIRKQTQHSDDSVTVSALRLAWLALVGVFESDRMRRPILRTIRPD